jgi:SAM-dependent methyltransferase
METIWNDAQQWERNWWMTERHLHETEIIKNDFVSKMMFLHNGVPDKTVIDIGCGPLSLLLRYPVKKGVGVDPIHYGDLEEQYSEKGIKRIIKCGEDLNIDDGIYDEAWIYNCLQHVKDPTKIIENALTISETVRIFEWTYIKPYTGHLHELTPDLLVKPFKHAGWHTLMQTTGFLNHSGLEGNYFMGIFSKFNRSTI